MPATHSIGWRGVSRSWDLETNDPDQIKRQVLVAGQVYKKQQQQQQQLDTVHSCSGIGFSLLWKDQY